MAVQFQFIREIRHSLVSYTHTARYSFTVYNTTHTFSVEIQEKFFFFLNHQHTGPQRDNIARIAARVPVIFLHSAALTITTPEVSSLFVVGGAGLVDWWWLWVHK